MATYIFLGVGLALGIIFIVQFSSLIELVVKREDYESEKWFCGILFGSIIVIILLAGIST